MITSNYKAVIAAALVCLTTTGLAQDAAGKPTRAPTLDELYSELTLVDTAISPSGRYVAAIVRREKDDILLYFDLTTGERKPLQKVAFTDAGKGLMFYMISVQWKTDEKLLLRSRVRPEDANKFFTVSSTKISKLGDRMYSVDRSTAKVVALLADNLNASALEGVFDLGAMKSILPRDPQHILMELDGFNGRSLYKVDVESGRGEQVERPSESVVGWWLDADGAPVVRVSIINRDVRLYRKEDGKWREFYRMRQRDRKEAPEYDPIGPSSEPDKYYVLAHPPGHDRLGIYLYDLKKEQFGEPVIENATYDIESAHVARDGSRVTRYCYYAHVRICEFTDPKINAHMRGLRKYFAESANLYIFDSSEDSKNFLLWVEGPGEPPAYYYYQTEKKDIQLLGSQRKILDDLAKPTASVVSWKSRDGRDLNGYLTMPANTAGVGKLPLVVYPHGGPEVRDYLSYDSWVQFMVARGYVVFQPNFRGSAGFGRQFAESGYGQWGGAMQDDITDGVKALVDKGTVDPSRVCIVGASYGGYAALAGAALTPDVYKCAVSVAGISDLDDMISWSKRTYGSDSEVLKYVHKVMGDPDKDAARIRAVSPAQQVDKIRIPILLVHGTDDGIVPIAQSRLMKKVLDKSGRKTELIELEKEGHGGWEIYNEVKVLRAIDQFLWKNLGPGHGITTPPMVVAVAK
ncbi:MAG TPA: prolyl oligopeptidase family serine peptidase [Steroidobacteraceae bacterium]|nr:prolyl oligopeptidase family serine peptidase [Steroidobacteraceae bacterium]